MAIGAGVSTAAQIPDFRSAAGLYYGVDGTGTCTGAGAGAEAENGTNHDESGERLIGESPRSTHTSTGAAPGTATPQSQRRNRGDPTIRELFHIKALTVSFFFPAILHSSWTSNYHCTSYSRITITNPPRLNPSVRHRTYCSPNSTASPRTPIPRRFIPSSRRSKRKEGCCGVIPRISMGWRARWG